MSDQENIPDKKRQHTRLNLPAQIETNGQVFDIRDISSGGLGVYNAKDYFTVGKIYSFDLHFPFEQSTMTLSLEAQIVHIDHDSQITGCRFININENQIELLTTIINSFMAGDLINADDFLNKQGAHNFLKIEKVEPDTPDNKEGVIGKIKNIAGSLFKRG